MNVYIIKIFVYIFLIEWNIILLKINFKDINGSCYI